MSNRDFRPNPIPGNKSTHVHQETKMEQKHRRRAEADKRNAKCRAMSPTDRIKELDYQFGESLGANKERARLKKLATQ